MLVIWGKGRNNKHARDMWVLDIASMAWKEVGMCLYISFNILCTQLMVDTRARMFHMSNAYFCNHDYQTDAIIFGGNIQRKSKFDKHVVTEMRVLKFGE